jgi:putative tryptophan/tyrosine transport system substrate-binding protein
MSGMRRREFVSMLAGAAAAWPLAARAQQSDQVRRIGVLMTTPETDTETQTRIRAFRQRLQVLGWIEGRNLRIDMRWGGADPGRAVELATELLGKAPDLIFVGNPIPLAAVLQQSRSVPIIFASVSDPVESGFVQSLSHPGGSVTGFTNFESKTAAKWLELLKEIAPGTARVIALRQTEAPGLLAMQRQIEEAAPSLGVRVTPTAVSTAAQVVDALDSFAAESNNGLIVLAGPIRAHRQSIITLAARHRLAAVYPYRFYVEGGGLLSYGPDTVDIYRRAAVYVDRILRGEKPANLPVQAPTKYELLLNLKTAKALGLEVPPPLLARADEVIE